MAEDESSSPSPTRMTMGAVAPPLGAEQAKIGAVMEGVNEAGSQPSLAAVENGNVPARLQLISGRLGRLAREKPPGAFGGMTALAPVLCATFAPWIASYP